MTIPINSITQSGQGVYTNLSDSITYFNSGISDYIGIGTTSPNYPIEISRRGPSGKTQRQLAIGNTNSITSEVLFLGTSDTIANLSEIEATTSAGVSAGSLIINRLGGAVGIGAIPTSSLTIKGNSSHTSVSESSQTGTNLTLNASTHKYFYYTRTYGGGSAILTASINNFKDGSEIYIFMTSADNASATSTEMHVQCSSTTTNYKNPNISGATNPYILYDPINKHTIKFLGATSELIALHLVSFGNTFYGSVISNLIS